MNIMSKSSSRHLVRLQVKLKPTEKEEKMCVYIHRFFSMFFHVPVYLSSVDFTGWFWVKRKSRKTVDVIVSTKICVFFFCLNFAWGRGSVARHPPLPGCANAVYAKKPTVPRLPNKLFAFCEIWRFTFLFIGSHYWSRSWARLIHSTPSHTLFLRTFNIILTELSHSNSHHVQHRWRLCR